MKYDFRVGDYVEDRAGYRGCVIRSDLLYFEDIFKKYIIAVEFGNEGSITYALTADEVKRKFKRIGQYDFTKKAEDKDDDKIEPLDYAQRFMRGSTIDTTFISYMKKINELVDAVNELRMRDAKESKDD